MIETHVLYHANCPDGFTAAAVVWGAHEDSAIYTPVEYQQPLPPIPDRSRVIMVDFSYPREVLEALSRRVSELIVLDHHKTAKEALAGLDFARFDLSKCGSRLAWEHFHPGKEVPELVRYVEDRDLWKWELPHSREVSAWLATVERNLSAYWDLLQRFRNTDNLFVEATTVGSALLAAKEMVIDGIVKHVRLVAIGSQAVHAVNTCCYQSEVGERLNLLYPEDSFSASFFIDKDGRENWSLRSKRSDVDVGAIAKQFGGGGHPGAAGFRVDRDTISKRVPSSVDPLRVPQDSQSGISAIFGKWPGNESDEEIERALEELS